MEQKEMEEMEMVQRRRLHLIPLLVTLALLSSAFGCPKDPYRASIQGSADVSQAVSSAVKITASYYSTGKLNDSKKALVANTLENVTNCNMTFRKAVVDTHNAGLVGVSACLPIADSFVQWASVTPQVMSDHSVVNILTTVQ